MQAFERDPSIPAGLNSMPMGSGLSPLEGWINCDGSSSARMAPWPKPISRVLLASGLVRGDHKRFLASGCSSQAARFAWRDAI